MGEIIRSYIFPHPPLIIPEVGRGEEKGAADTINAVKKAAEDIKNDAPSTIVVTTPHGPVFQDYIHISMQERLAGDMSRFGANDVRFEFENNLLLAKAISSNAEAIHIPAGGLSEEISARYKISKSLDHGALVPLYFIKNIYDSFKLVHISISGLSFEDQYRFGKCIAKAVAQSDERVVFLASGDLSHRLTNEGPYGYSEYGKLFDDMLIESLRNLDVERLITTDESFCENAGECGLRSFIMMFGALDGYDLEPEVYSYEGPFGVGYSVAKFTVGGKNPERHILDKLEFKNKLKMQGIRENEDPYVKLARTTLETYIKEDRIIEIPKDIPEELIKNSAGTFVSLKKSGQLRGCIGTIEPTKDNIAEEIMRNAISSATEDPRFNPVAEEELDKLVYSVDVLMPAEDIKSMDELDVVKYGVIVKLGRRTGLLLPNLDGVYTAEQQVSIALQKAGIKPNENYAMQRFEVIRHK